MERHRRRIVRAHSANGRGGSARRRERGTSGARRLAPAHRSFGRLRSAAAVSGVRARTRSSTTPVSAVRTTLADVRRGNRHDGCEHERPAYGRAGQSPRSGGLGANLVPERPRLRIFADARGVPGLLLDDLVDGVGQGVAILAEKGAAPGVSKGPWVVLLGAARIGAPPAAGEDSSEEMALMRSRGVVVTPGGWRQRGVAASAFIANEDSPLLRKLGPTSRSSYRGHGHSSAPRQELEHGR